MNPLTLSSLIRPIRLSGRVKTILFLSTIRDSHPQACWPLQARQILPLPCTCSHGFQTIGTAAIVEFPGVLYRGGAEQKIRKYLIDNNYIDAVIQLPPDLFFGTPIATCIIILKKSKTDNKTLFIDASAEFVRGGNKNKLSKENRTRILEAYTHREDSEYFAQLVSNQAIGENDYNIAVSSYVEQEDTREVVNITELNKEIAQIVSKQNELRISIDAIVADIEGAK